MSVTDATQLGYFDAQGNATLGPATEIKTYVGSGGGSPAWADVTGKPTTFAPIIGATGADAVAGNDARLTDARKPAYVAGDGGSCAGGGR